MGNGAHGEIVYRGYRPHRQWGTTSMGHIDNRATEGMGSMGNGAQGVWATWAMGYRGMGNEAHWGYRVQGYGAHGQ